MVCFEKIFDEIDKICQSAYCLWLLDKTTVLELLVLKLGPSVNAVGGNHYRRFLESKFNYQCRRLSSFNNHNSYGIQNQIGTKNSRSIISDIIGNVENVPLLTLDTFLCKFKNVEFCSRLDPKNTYHQPKFSEDSWVITTFIAHTEMFRYKRLMFGINFVFDFNEFFENTPSSC